MLTQASRTSIMIAFLLGFASIQAEDIPAGIMPYNKRQAGTGVTPSTSDPPPTSTQVPDPSTTTSDPPTSDAPTSDAPVTSDAPTSNDNTGTTTTDDNDNDNNQATSTPTTVAVTTTNADGSQITTHVSTEAIGPVQTKSGSKNSVVQIGSKTINPATLSKKTTITSALIGKSTKHSTFTSYWTSDGQVYSSVVTRDQVVSSTTGFATATVNPSLADGGGDGSNLSTNAKKIIGGVVGGIGGAILIGGLAFVAWRLWGKKKREEAMQDEYADGSQNDSLRREKRSSGMTFDTEPYHTPGRVNTASNF